MKCEGCCFEDGSCSGEVKQVSVTGPHDWGTFNYCDTAISEDRRRGFTVTILTPAPAVTKESEK